MNSLEAVPQPDSDQHEESYGFILSMEELRDHSIDYGEHGFSEGNQVEDMEDIPETDNDQENFVPDNDYELNLEDSADAFMVYEEDGWKNLALKVDGDVYHAVEQEDGYSVARADIDFSQANAVFVEKDEVFETVEDQDIAGLLVNEYERIQCTSSQNLSNECSETGINLH